MPSIITGRPASKNLLVWAALAAGVFGAAGCDKVPLLAPSQSTITLSTTNTVVQSNGTAEVSATVLEQSGTPVQNGTTVTFSTTLGTLSPTESRTFNGVATVQFVANGQSGIAEIRATSGAAKPSDTNNPSLKLTVGGAAVARVLVTASPSRVSAGGTSTITASVSDTNGNALSGVTVAFSADAGNLSSSVATTNSGGQAVTTLTTTRDATVTATAGASSGATAVSGTVKVTVALFPGLAIAVAGTTAPVQGQPVTFTVTVTPGTADPFQSIVINYGDGQTSGNIGGSSTSVSHTYNSSGSFTVTATGTTASGDSTSVSTIISVAPPTPISVNLSSTQTTSAPNTIFNFTAAVTPTGTPVSSYAWTFGDPGGSSRTTTGNQTTYSYLTATGARTVTVTVTSTSGQTGTTSTTVVP